MVPARELRFSFVIDHYEAAVYLYRDVFGLEVLEDLDEQGGRGVILNVPEATLELVDAEHAGMVDDVEVGRRVDDLGSDRRQGGRSAGSQPGVAETGGEAMAPPVDTPWGDKNQRFRAKDGMQLTLFQSP
jgi:lactoylglutathione lyase